MKQTGNSAQAARAEMDHAQAELMEILWKKEQAAKKAGKGAKKDFEFSV